MNQLKLLLPLFALLILAVPGRAQQSEMFGPYELHYSVVNTTFLAPEVASTYGIVRATDRAILNLAVREHPADGQCKLARPPLADRALAGGPGADPHRPGPAAVGHGSAGD